jgi:dUTP pyrophosphatase
MKLKIKLLSHTAQLPAYAREGDSGMDLHADLPLGPVELQPGESKLLPTSISIELPEGYEGQVRPRSGMAAKYGMTVLNAPGTIDNGYRGPVGVILYNSSHYCRRINHGDRIAQLVIAPVTSVVVEMADELSDTERGDGGFGSTGR